MGNKPKIKTPELVSAKKALIAYFNEHDLDPSDKSLMKDPVHGKILTDLVNKLNKERDKVMANYPAADRSNNLKLLKMAKKEKEAKKAKKVEETPKTEKKSKGRVATKYDYPQVKDEKTGKMRDMTSDEKKKFRVEARKKVNGNTPKPKKEKTADAPVPKREDKKVKDKKKDKKKAKKEED